MPKETSNQRPIRNSRRHNPYGFSADQVTALRNPRHTRSQRSVQEQIDSGEVFVRPAIPQELFRGDRPSWQDYSGIWRTWGPRTCTDCDAPADSVDHVIDWKLYIMSSCDEVDVAVPGGSWRGYRKDDVAAAYNDIRNLAPMCQSCNSRKNGPKNIDRLQPTFTRNH